MKVINGLVFIIAINLIMVIFLGISPPGSALWKLVTGLEGWSDLSLIEYFKDGLALAGGAIVIGAVIMNNDLAVKAGFATIFLSFGVGLVEFYQWLNSEPYFTGYTWLSMIIIAPIAMVYLYTILAFWFKGE